MMIAFKVDTCSTLGVCALPFQILQLMGFLKYFCVNKIICALLLEIDYFSSVKRLLEKSYLSPNCSAKPAADTFYVF